MKNSYNFLPVLPIMMFLLYGCVSYNVSEEELANPRPKTIPCQVPEQKEPSPAVKKDTVKKPLPPPPPPPAGIEKKTVAVSEKNLKKNPETIDSKPPVKIIADPGKKQTAPVPPKRTSYTQASMWRAFTRLSQDEQRELLKLQRTDYKRYLEIMQNKADKLDAQEKAKKLDLDELAKKYHMATVQAEKDLIKAEFRRKLKEDYLQRLQDTRQDIDSYKRRITQLESEVQKREKNCDAIVEAILNDRLTQKK